MDKLSGVFAPRPTSGPHKLRECIPLAILLRNRLKLALTYNEVKMIAMQKLVKVDGKIRTDKTFPCGLMDVVSLDKANSHMRLLLDTKGRFVPHKISPEEASFKLCKVRKVQVGKKRVPHAYLSDGRTVRFVHPDVKINDTLKIDLATGKPVEHVKMEIGALALVTNGHSMGRIGRVIAIENHDASVNMVTLQDARKETFCTTTKNVFIIGTDGKALITLPKEKGIKRSVCDAMLEKRR